MVLKGYPVAVEGGFDVVAVALDHGIPDVRAGDRADRNNLVGAAGDTLSEGIGH